MQESDITSNANVTFLGNSAYIGGGMYAIDCNMKFMRFTTFTSSRVGLDGGGLFLKISSLVCNGTTTFTLNKGGSDTAGGGLYAFDTVVRLSGNVCFTKNEVSNGGGMYIDGSSQLVLKSPVTINFDDNIARTDGAALKNGESDAYIHRCYSLPLRNNCILKAEVTNSSTLEDIYLNFTNNYDFDDQTNTVVTWSTVKCKYSQSNGFQFLKNVSTFTPGGIKGSISSQPLKVCFCKMEHLIAMEKASNTLV